MICNKVELCGVKITTKQIKTAGAYDATLHKWLQTPQRLQKSANREGGALVVWGFKEHDNRRPKLEFQKVFFCVLLAG